MQADCGLWLSAYGCEQRNTQPPVHRILREDPVPDPLQDHRGNTSGPMFHDVHYTTRTLRMRAN